MKLNGYKTVSASFSLLSVVGVASAKTPQTPPPNIMIVLVDDMGYSDIGCYGGEIQTPNVNALAKSGLRFTQFYNTARSCPTRASLLTGLNPHMAGVGWMVNVDQKQPGYTGELSKNAVTIPEVLKTAGYSTYMSGKWHVVKPENVEPGGDNSNWPMQRGFDRYFGTLIGSGSYYNPAALTDGNTPISAKDTPEFFYTDQIANHAIEFVTDHAKKKEKNPFFMYVAFTAPHWPLHARAATIEKYMKMYEIGWDKLREQRYDRMVKMGIIKPEWRLSPRDEESFPWESLSAEEKKIAIKRMAIYAAMVDEMDQNLGRIVASLKKNKQYDNTLILFLSDNGGCAEDISRGDTSYEALGTEASFESYRLPWANASNTPFRLFKHWVHEGGISTPLIAHWPKGIKAKGEFRDQPGCLLDFMPTCVELSGAVYPTTFKGNAIPPMEGVSIAKRFDGTNNDERYLFWEHEGNCAARKGDWKIVYKASTTYPFERPWQLYNLRDDRSELNNLASKYPEKVKEMSDAWNQWASTHMVFPLDGRDTGARTKMPVFVPTVVK